MWVSQSKTNCSSKQKLLASDHMIDATIAMRRDIHVNCVYVLTTSDILLGVGSSTQIMENPHAERQNVLLQRIIKNVVSPNVQPIRLQTLLMAMRPPGQGNGNHRRIEYLPGCAHNTPFFVFEFMSQPCAPGSHSCKRPGRDCGGFGHQVQEERAV